MEESDRSEPTARHNTNNAAPCALSVYAQSGRAEQRDSAFPAAFPRQRRSLVSTSPRRWLMLRRCRNYSASEQFDEGFGLDSGREMCRSGVSPGYNWMEGKRGGTTGGPAPHSPVLRIVLTQSVASCLLSLLRPPITAEHGGQNVRGYGGGNKALLSRDQWRKSISSSRVHRAAYFTWSNFEHSSWIVNMRLKISRQNVAKSVAPHTHTHSHKHVYVLLARSCSCVCVCVRACVCVCVCVCITPRHDKWLNL